MMSFALMGCLIIGASDASAQGRSRSQGGSTSSRSQSAAVSRSNSSTAPTVSHSSSRPSVSHSSSATPQVNRSTTSRSTTDNRGTVARPSTNTTSNRTTVDRSTSTTSNRTSVDRGTSNNRGNDNRGSRVGGATNRGSGISTGTATRPTGNSTGTTVRSGDKTTTVKTVTGTSERTDRNTITTTRPSTMGKPDGRPSGNGNRPNGGNGNRPNGGNDKPNGGDNGHKGNGHNGNNGNGGIHNDHNGNQGGHNGNGGIHNDHSGKKGNRPGGNHNDHSGNKPGGHDNHGKHDGKHGFNPKHRYDYTDHHYRDEFRRNYTNHNWSRPLPPPARPHRPAPIVWRRPVIPVGWHPYAGAPVIDRILGLMFGTLYDISLDHLYYNGYYIDGYADNIIYLRDVSMLNLYWPDVMLNYEYGKLVNAQFIYHSSYYDRVRFDRAYYSLCRIYGSPVFDDGMTASWYGGNNTGWVTLSLSSSYGDYYTTMSIGY